VLNLTTFFIVVTTVKDHRLFLQSFYTFPQLLAAVIGVVNGCYRLLTVVNGVNGC